MKTSNQNAVPSSMQERFDAVMGIVDPFCRTNLNEEYAVLCRRMAATLCRKRPLPLMGGTARVWACAIIYAAGRVNFLFDKSQKPHIPATELCRLLDVSQASASAKSGQILDILKAMPMDPRWSLPSRLADNPLAWMITVNGIIMDARSAPREVQEEAFRLGLIPYLHGGNAGNQTADKMEE